MNTSNDLQIKNEEDENNTLEHFEAQRRTARRRRYQALTAALGIGVLCVALLAATFLFMNRGVRLIIQPQDAADTATVTMLDGAGITIGGHIYTMSSRLRVRVSAAGFFPEETTIAAHRSSNIVNLRLRERPAELTIYTEPPTADTRWQVNSEVITTASMFAHEIFPGNHVLVADSPFHERVEQSLSLEREQQYESTISLTPIQGQMIINTEPAGANVHVNDEALGKTPLNLQTQGGEYRLQLTLANHADITETVRITRNRPRLQRNYRLQPDPGVLSINVSPGGGRLTVNGTIRSVSSQPFQLAPDVPHAVTYSRDGFGSVSQTITLASTEQRNLNLTLQPQIGAVRVESTPPAQVLVNGQAQGNTPLSLSLPAMEQKITISKTGYDSVERILRPTPDAEQLISVKLLTIEEAKLQASKSSYINNVGLEMRRFQPSGGFTMGAARDERGQRSNEHLKQVRLTRPFYVSRTEVTNAQYQRFRSSNSNNNLPVTNVSWNDAAQFCNWLATQEGLTPFYRFAGQRYVGANTSADGYRLPTEAEWEWLARMAGRRQATRFTWGSSYQVPEKAGNFADITAANDSSVSGQLNFYLPQYTDGFARLAPPGSFNANRAGLFDLSGNVSEWVHDLYSIAPPPDGAGPALDPTGPSFGESHVIKGSSWKSGRVEYLRAAYRTTGNDPLDDVGFRVARYIY